MARSSSGNQQVSKRAKATEAGASAPAKGGTPLRPNDKSDARLPYSLGSLGVEIQRRRQVHRISQEDLASQAGTSRTTVSLVEQGRRIPPHDVLTRIIEILELTQSPFAHLADPAEQLRLRFEQSIGEMTGKAVRLEDLDPDTIAVARAAISDMFRRDKTKEQAYDAFRTVLVFYDVPVPTLQFFEHYIGADGLSSAVKLEECVEKFQRDAIRLFATFSEAYQTLALTRDLQRHLKPLQMIPDDHYRRRETWNVIENIPPQRLADLGYISAARVRQEQEERQSLHTFLIELANGLESNGVDALRAHPERKRRKMGSLLRKIGSSLNHDFLSPLFSPDRDQLRREAARVAPKEEGELARIAETQAIGQRNLARYLSADHLDVYVATSMRSDADFASVHSFVQSLFGHDDVRPLKLRYFNPTQSWIEDRVAKGLVEALMLRRSDFTIYMAQKEDTFGKDSEASVALGQGKPVIVYVPRLHVPEAGVDSAEIGGLQRDALLKRLANEVPVDDVDDTADAQALIAQIISAKLGKADSRVLAAAAMAHWADFDLGGEAGRIENEELRTSYRAWIDSVIRDGGGHPLPEALRMPLISVLTSLATNFEKRARVFREVHPLALQVILSTGVLNGILVVRSIDNCARLLSNLIRNQLNLELLPDENNYRLIETSTHSTIRVISRHQLIVNAFAAFYRADKAPGGIRQGVQLRYDADD